MLLMWVYANFRRLASCVDCQALLHLVFVLLHCRLCASIGDSASDVTGVSRLNSVGEDKSTLCKMYRSLLPIHPCWHELLSSTCRSVDLNLVPIRDEEHDACGTMRLYKDTMRDGATELVDPLESVRAPARRS